MKIQTNGISEAVLEVNNMDRAVDFWVNKIGFPIVEQWGTNNGQFTEDTEHIWATWLYVGGVSRLGLWLPRKFNEDQLNEKKKPISEWQGLFDEGGRHVHLALNVSHFGFDDAVSKLKEIGIEIKLIMETIHKRVYFKDTEDNIIEFYTLNMNEDYLDRLNKGLIK